MKLPSVWKVPDTIRARFGRDTSGKQRAMFHEGHLLLVLHAVPRQGAREREGVFFWRKPDGEWEFSGGGRGIGNLRHHVEQYREAEAELDKSYDRAQEGEDYFRLLEEVGPLLRAANNQHTTLQAAREAIRDDREIIELRDQAYDLVRNLELLYADAKNGLDYQVARKAEEQSRLGQESLRTANRLNVIAALFLPLTAVTSLFGMNLRSGLEPAPALTFWVMGFLALSVGFIMKGWVLAKPAPAVTSSAPVRDRARSKRARNRARG